MGILSGYLGLEFFEYCYTPLGEMMDMLTLLVRSRDPSQKLIWCVRTAWLTSYSTAPCQDSSDRPSGEKSVQFCWMQNFVFVLNTNLSCWKFWRIIIFKTIFRKIFKIRRGGRWFSLMKSCNEADKSSPVENIYIEKYLLVSYNTSLGRVPLNSPSQKSRLSPWSEAAFFEGCFVPF